MRSKTWSSAIRNSEAGATRSASPSSPNRQTPKKMGGEIALDPPNYPGAYFFFFAAFFLAAFFFAGIEVIPPFSPDLDTRTPLSTYRVSRGFAY